MAIIRAARATLREALRVDWPALTLSAQAETWLLGQCWGESRFGSTPDWGTSNNWGAVTYHLADGQFVQHNDHDAHGNPVTYRFQAYPSQLAAARDWLRVLLRHDVPRALLGGTATDLARAMYANRYYTGVAGTPEERIAAYATLIRSSAAYVEERLAVADGMPDLGTVLGVQTALSRLGHDPGPLDGVTGPKTRAAVVAFQLAHALLADGIVGPITRAALLVALRTAA